MRQFRRSNSASTATPRLRARRGARTRERLLVPNAPPARHSLAAHGRWSRRAASVRPLPRAPLWPLVPQRRLQKRPAVLLNNLRGKSLQKAAMRNYVRPRPFNSGVEHVRDLRETPVPLSESKAKPATGDHGTQPFSAMQVAPSSQCGFGRFDRCTSRPTFHELREQPAASMVAS